MTPRVNIQRDVRHRSLPGLPHSPNSGRGPSRMTDDTPTAEVQKILRSSRPSECLRRLSSPLAGTDDGKRTIAWREQRRLDRLERAYERIIGLPVFHPDAID